MKTDTRKLVGLLLATLLLVTGQGCGSAPMDSELRPVDDPNADAPGSGGGSGREPDVGPDPDPELPPITELEPELVMLGAFANRVHLWGTSENDMFLAGRRGLLAHFDGTAWRPFESDSKRSHANFTWIFGFASDDVYAGTGSGLVFHYDGGDWHEIDALSQAQVLDLWGSAADDIYAVSASTILHFDGFEWTEVPADLPKGVSWTDITGSGEKHLVLIGRDSQSPKSHLVHFDGVEWSVPALPPSRELTDVWSAGPTETFAVGRDGVIVSFDGATVTRMDSGTAAELVRVHGTSSGDVFAVGLNTALHFDGDAWSDVAMPPDPTETSYRHVTSVFALASDSVFVGDRGLYRFDGESWETCLPYAEVISDIWASSSDDVLFAGTQPHRYDGFTIESEDFGVLDPPGLRTVWGTGDRIFAVGYGGEEFFLYDSESWGRLASDEDGNIYDMSGTSEDDVFAVGSSGRVAHFDGTTWQDMDSGIDSPLYGVWAFAPDDVYAVGDEGTVLHYDGSAWSELFGGEAGDYFSVLGFDGGHIIAPNSANAVYFSDGVSWRPEPTSDIRAVHGTAPNNVYGAGSDGLRHYDGEIWTPLSTVAFGEEPIVFAVEPHEVYVAGNTGVLRFRPSRR